MQRNWPPGSDSDASNLPQLPSNNKPRPRIQRKQPAQDNSGFQQENDFRSRTDTNPSLKPSLREEKPYRKVVRKKPKPSTVDSEAAAQIEARERALANRSAKPNHRRQAEEIEPSDDDEPSRDPAQPSALSNQLNSVLTRTKQKPPVVTNQRKSPKPKRQKSEQDEDLYDLPNISRTNSELEAELEYEYEEEEEENSTCPPDKRTLLYIISFALFILVIAAISTTLGILLNSCEDNCQYGDVRLLDNVPEIYYDEEWQPLCGECIAKEDGNDDNNLIGVTKFCKVLGYEKGKVLDNENVTYAEDAFYFNTTFTYEHTWPMGDTCVSQNVTNGNGTKSCDRGMPGLQIECSNPFLKNKTTTSSC